MDHQAEYQQPRGHDTGKHCKAADMAGAGDDAWRCQAANDETGEIRRAAEGDEGLALADRGGPQRQQGEMHAVADEQQRRRQEQRSQCNQR